jgi:hypothetical protein
MCGWLGLFLAVCAPASARVALQSELASVARAGGGSDLFVVDRDQTIKHYFRNDQRARWSGVEQLDGLARDIAAIDLGDGRFEVFVVGTDGNLWSNRQLDRALWTGFRPTQLPCKQVAVARTDAGRFELFVVRPDGAVARSVRTGADGVWSSWQNMGGVATQLAAAAAADGSVRVFVVGGDGAVWTSDSASVAWHSLGGKVSDVSVGRAADGGMVVYAVAERGALWQRRALDAGSRFGAWEALPGSAQRIAAAGGGAGHRLFALGRGVSELDPASGELRTLAIDNLPLEATFVGMATMEIPSLDVTQRKHVRIGVRFSADRKRVRVTSFPAFTTLAFDTPFGKSQTTVSLKSGGSGTFDPETGKLDLQLTLHLDQSLDVPFVQEDADVALALSSDGERGVPIGRGAGQAQVQLAASSRFVAAGLSPLDHKTCHVTIAGGFPFPARALRGR